jgi:hypothetical protein
MIFARSCPSLRKRSTLPRGRLARQVKPRDLGRGVSGPTVGRTSWSVTGLPALFINPEDLRRGVPH